MSIPIDSLPETWRRRLLMSVNANRSRLNRNGVIISSGRTVPEVQDLSIGQGRRIEAVVAFLDICGFSNIPANTVDEQESLIRSLSLFFCEMIRIIEIYGGVVEKNTGDGLMAYFCNPIFGGKNVAQRCLACFMSMFFVYDRIIRKSFELDSFVQFDFRISADLGQVTIARLGAARRFNQIVAVGSTANRAAKLLRFGGPGDILVGYELARHAPANWMLHFSELGAESGWVFSGTDFSYPVYKFGGRWA